MLAEVDVVTKSLQLSDRILAECRCDLDTLIDAVDVELNNSSMPLFGCKLGDKLLATEVEIVLSKVFDQGVIKIQSIRAGILTLDERRSVKRLEKKTSQMTALIT